jgi:SAM-dependent methyltransferase
VKLWIDDITSGVAPGCVPNDWATRAAFSYRGAASHWKSRTSSAVSLEENDAVLSLYTSALAKLDPSWTTVVSLGAGTGFVDKAIIQYLNLSTRYIPVDLTKDMCEAAIMRLGAVCDVPMAVVADFEGNFIYVRKALAAEPKSRTLYCCTATVGNLDLGETSFLRNVLSIMDPQDCLLVSIPTGSFGYPVNRDRFDATVGWRELSALLAGSIAMMTGESAEAAEAALDSRLDVRSGISDVSEAETVDLWDRISGRTLLHFRRYRLAALQRWIEQSMSAKVLCADELCLSTESGVGVLVLAAR